MKLAEALQERADLNRSIAQLKSRLEASTLVQQGEQPLEDPVQLKQSLDSAIQRLAWLIARINHTNCITQAEGRTLTEWIAQKDALTLQIQLYREILQEASQANYRARGTEIRILPTISVPSWQAELDDLCRQLRLLDNLLQKTNWETDLLEGPLPTTL